MKAAGVDRTATPAAATGWTVREVPDPRTARTRGRSWLRGTGRRASNPLGLENPQRRHAGGDGRPGSPLILGFDAAGEVMANLGPEVTRFPTGRPGVRRRRHGNRHGGAFVRSWVLMAGHGAGRPSRNSLAFEEAVGAPPRCRPRPRFNRCATKGELVGGREGY